jgi:hypothetical protein
MYATLTADLEVIEAAGARPEDKNPREPPAGVSNSRFAAPVTMTTYRHDRAALHIAFAAPQLGR